MYILLSRKERFLSTQILTPKKTCVEDSYYQNCGPTACCFAGNWPLCCWPIEVLVFICSNNFTGSWIRFCLSLDATIKRFATETHLLRQAFLLPTFSTPVVRALKEHVRGFVLIRDVGSQLATLHFADISESCTHASWRFHRALSAC